MIFIYNYIKLTLWSTIYYYQKDKSEIIRKIIINTIKDSGCIAIKFSQWLLPKIESIYNINPHDPSYEWFRELEELYDNCNEHSIEYTYQIYNEDFQTSFQKEFEIDRLIASGSIGQVYKAKSKIDNKYYAIKCLHPNLKNQITFFEIIIWFLYNCPILKNYVKYYLPIKLTDFIKDFRIQINLINEANNCLKFSDFYKDNDKIIIPTLHKISERMIIMSYEEGIKYEDSSIDEYTMNKIFILMKLFIKNNEHILNFIHGDLHKGNWKVSIHDNDIKLIIYDFGFCWYLPEFLIDHLHGIDNTFFKASDDTIDEFAYYSHIIVNKICSKEEIKKEIEYIRNTLKLSYNNPYFLITLIINTMRRNKKLIDSYVMQSIIVHNQLYRSLKKYDISESNVEEHDYKEIVSEYYKRRILDIINYCDTYDIFQQYVLILKKEYEENKHLVKESKLINYDSLKNLAIS